LNYQRPLYEKFIFIDSAGRFIPIVYDWHFYSRNKNASAYHFCCGRRYSWFHFLCSHIQAGHQNTFTKQWQKDILDSCDCLRTDDWQPDLYYSAGCIYQKTNSKATDIKFVSKRIDMGKKNAKDDIRTSSENELDRNRDERV